MYPTRTRGAHQTRARGLRQTSTYMYVTYVGYVHVSDTDEGGTIVTIRTGGHTQPPLVLWCFVLNPHRRSPYEASYEARAPNSYGVIRDTGKLRSFVRMSCPTHPAQDAPQVQVPLGHNPLDAPPVICVVNRSPAVHVWHM